MNSQKCLSCNLRQESIVIWVDKKYYVKPYFYLHCETLKASWFEIKPSNVSWIKLCF